MGVGAESLRKPRRCWDEMSRTPEMGIHNIYLEVDVKERHRMTNIATAPKGNCRNCGVPIVTVVSAGKARELNQDPHPQGSYVVLPLGQVLFDLDHRRAGTMRLMRHQCLRPSRCKYCNGEIYVLNFGPDTPPQRIPGGETLVVVDVEPTDDGQIRTDEYGWARWRQPGESWGYPWHTKH